MAPFIGSLRKLANLMDFSLTTMMEKQLAIYQNLLEWFKRRTTTNAVRRVGVLSLALSTDVGLVRSENQDRCAVLRTRSNDGKALVVAVVCDGMGGMESGAECASKAITSFLYHCSRLMHKSTDALLKDAILEANEVVFSDHKGRGGATLSAFCLDYSGKLVGVNVGDSRIYCFDDGKLIQISSDDTLAGQFGNSSGEFIHRHELIQYIGIGNGIEPHILPIEISKDRDMRPLITSDGVHFLDSSLMASIIKHSPEPAKAAQRLTELSKWCGGKDNATSILALSYDQLIEFRDGSRPDVIEIWDPFGELQLHFIKSYETENTDNYYVQPNKNRDPTQFKPKKNKRKQKTKSKQHTNLSNFNDKEKSELPSKEKPQLKINFDSTEGE